MGHFFLVVARFGPCFLREQRAAGRSTAGQPGIARACSAVRAANGIEGSNTRSKTIQGQHHCQHHCHTMQQYSMPTNILPTRTCCSRRRVGWSFSSTGQTSTHPRRAWHCCVLGGRRLDAWVVCWGCCCCCCCGCSWSVDPVPPNEVLAADPCARDWRWNPGGCRDVEFQSHADFF